MQTTDQMIENMIVAIVGPLGSARQTYYLRTSLQLLMRTAKAEYAAEMKRSVALAVGDATTPEGKRKSRVVARKLLATLQSKQARLDFDQGPLH